MDQGSFPVQMERRKVRKIRYFERGKLNLIYNILVCVPFLRPSCGGTRERKAKHNYTKKRDSIVRKTDNDVAKI